MKSMILTLFFLCECAAFCFAQIEENFLPDMPRIQTKEAMIRQIIQSQNLTEYGSTVIQSGHSNELTFKLTGPKNKATGIQVGNYNDMSLEVNARGTNYLLQQDGNYNNIELMNMTSNGIDFELTQRQNSNSLKLDGGSNIPSLKIEQSGGMHLIIQSNMSFIK